MIHTDVYTSTSDTGVCTSTSDTDVYTSTSDTDVCTSTSVTHWRMNKYKWYTLMYVQVQVMMRKNVMFENSTRDPNAKFR